MKQSLSRVALSAALLITLFMTPALAGKNTLMVYSTDASVLELAKAYTQATGIPVDYRMQTHAELLNNIDTGPADLILGQDMNQLQDIADANLLLPVASRSMERKIPAIHRDPGNRWYGLSMRTSIDGKYHSLSGAAVLKSSKNPVEAAQFLKWLAGNTAQKILSRTPDMAHIAAIH